MSWDVMIFKFAGEPPRTVGEIKNANRIPLGTAEEVRASISRILGAVDWTDPTWGTYEGDGFSIEFNVGRKDPIEHAALHVHGGGDAVSAIMALVRALGWSAIDGSTDEFLDPAAPCDAGWKGFQAFRDQVSRRAQKRDA
ncbi:MAG TPA: hypothetical protein VGI81_14085 [Tepidisphaeraceae bacterium]|jgi:hypothetical protein